MRASFDAMETSSLRFCLHIYGSPSPVVTLYRIISSGRIAVSRAKYSLNNDCLLFMQLGVDDTGRYMIEATNCFATDHLLVNISVSPQPTTIAPTTMTRSTTEQPTSGISIILGELIY